MIHKDCTHKFSLRSVRNIVLACVHQTSKFYGMSKEMSPTVYQDQNLKQEVKWSEVAQSCPTLCNAMDCSPPGSLVHGIFQAWILEWVAISFFRGSPWSRAWTCVFCFSFIGKWVLYHCTTEKPQNPWIWYFIGLTKSSFRFSCKIFQKILSVLSGQPNTWQRGLCRCD